MKSALDHYVHHIRQNPDVCALFSFILLFSFSHKMSTVSLTKVNKSKSSMFFLIIHTTRILCVIYCGVFNVGCNHYEKASSVPGKTLTLQTTLKTIYSKRVHQLRLMCFKGIYSNVPFFRVIQCVWICSFETAWRLCSKTLYKLACSDF